MQKQSVKPAFSAHIWGAWGIFAALMFFLLLFLIPFITSRFEMTPLWQYAAEMGVIACIFLPMPITTSMRYRKPAMLRRAGANQDDTKTVALAITPRLIPAILPIQVRLSVPLRYFAVRLPILIFGVAFLLGLSALYAPLDLGYKFMPVTGAFAIIGAFLYYMNNSQITYTTSPEGLEMRKRWTCTFIRWQDVRLFWSLGSHTVDPQELSMPSRFAQYDIASKNQRILFIIRSNKMVTKYADDPQTYYARMSDILYTIAHQSGVALREPRFEKKTKVKRPTKK